MDSIRLSCCRPTIFCYGCNTGGTPMTQMCYRTHDSMQVMNMSFTSIRKYYDSMKIGYTLISFFFLPDAEKIILRQDSHWDKKKWISYKKFKMMKIMVRSRVAFKLQWNLLRKKFCMKRFKKNSSINCYFIRHQWAIGLFECHTKTKDIFYVYSSIPQA